MTTPMEPENRPAFVLDRTTLIPIGLLVAVVLSAISATVWINTYLLTLKQEVETANREVAAIRQDLREQIVNRWTADDMAAWVQLANAKNTFPLPSPTTLHK